MRLLFLVQKAAWFIEHGHSWYRVQDMQQVALALSALALNLVNQHDLVEQPHQAGHASVLQRDQGTVSVALHSPDNRLVDTVDIALSEDILLNVDWKTKPYRDGWLGSEVLLTLDNVSSLYLEAYLPGRSDSDGKTLKISNTDTGTSVDVWIARNRKSRIPIVENGCEGKVALRLSCEPEQMDQPADSRQLGFVIIEQEARPV